LEYVSSPSVSVSSSSSSSSSPFNERNSSTNLVSRSITPKLNNNCYNNNELPNEKEKLNKEETNKDVNFTSLIIENETVSAKKIESKNNISQVNSENKINNLINPILTNSVLEIAMKLIEIQKNKNKNKLKTKIEKEKMKKKMIKEIQKIKKLLNTNINIEIKVIKNIEKTKNLIKVENIIKKNPVINIILKEDFMKITIEIMKVIILVVSIVEFYCFL